MKAFSAGLIALAAAVAMLSGCTVSLQPFYSKATLLDDRSIEGRWTDGETTWQITRTRPAHYDIAACEEDSGDCKADTVGVLFRTSDVTFLDFQEKAESNFSTVVHPHGLFQVHMEDDAIDLMMLDQDRLTNLAKDGRLDTEFADLESGFLLTAASADLQSFVLRHLSDPQVFAESHRLRRPEPVTE
ncbi:MAG TPA: hypothetical protein VGL53_05665 [Bryobacteraceae bacterium]|jgi:hypothetical protein